MKTQVLLVFCCLAVTLTTAQVLHCLVHPTLDEKLNRNADFNDHNNDSVIDSHDIAYDLNNNYDRNHDHQVTESEWIVRWPCAFGDTREFASFAFNQISQGEASIRANQFTGEPFASGIPRSQFISLNRQRYHQFDSLHCISKTLTTDEKLAINARHNDHDNNHVVTSSDIAYDLNHNYDANHDGKVTQFEWVMRWICAYGDTGDFARYVWDQIAAKGADSIQASQFSGPPFNTGIPLDAFKANNRQRYTDYIQERIHSIGK